MSNSNHKHVLKAHGFKKSVRIRDEATGMVVDVLRVPLYGGKFESLEISPSEQTPRKMFSLLRNKDAILPKDTTERAHLIDAICEYTPGKRLHYAGHGGWNVDRTAFVAQSVVIGGQGQGLRGMAPAAETVGQLEMKGSADTWRANIATLAQQSSMLITCISAAFAAPLLPITGEQSFGLCFFGNARIGKSMSVLAAASLIGIGQSKLPTWNLSNPGFENLLFRLRHMVCPVDDFEAIGLVGAARHNRVEGLSYLLTSGTARVHHQGYDLENGRAREPWCSVMLTTSEQALSDIAGGRSRRKGATLRFIDVPAILKGDDVFDRLVWSPQESSRGDARSAMFRNLYGAFASNQGVAFLEYLEFLIERRDQLLDLTNASVAAFREKVRDDTDSDMTRDLARKFGLIFAGAEMAMLSKAVGWPESVVLESIILAYRAARDLLPDEAKDLREGMAQLTSALRRLPRLSSRHRNSPRLVATELPDGYRWRSGCGNHYLIRNEAFERIFPSICRSQAVVKLLMDQGKIELASPKKSKSSEFEPKAQHTWIDGERRRSIRINLPVHRSGSGD